MIKLFNRLAAWLKAITVNSADSRLSFKVIVAAYFFKPKRGDYYRYIADIITATKGKKKLKQIFKDDAERYGTASRGILSAHWGEMFEKHGGKFNKTFSGTLPNDEVIILSLLQNKGGENILPEGLRDLASSTGTMKVAVNSIKSAIFGFVVPFGLMVLMLAGIPLFSVPELKDMFSDLPPERYPKSAQTLFAISDFISSNAMFLSFALAAILVAVVYSLPRLKGRARLIFDKYLIVWSIYRDFEAVKFLSNLALILKNRNSKSERLSEALETLKNGAGPWKMDIINKMSENLLQRGVELKTVFRVGLFDREMQFELEDLIESLGLNQALEYLRPRLETRVISKLQRRCKTFMWLMLLTCTGVIAYMFFLHSNATQDLQQAMTKLY